MINSTRLFWNIRGTDVDVISVSPNVGSLLPRESTTVTFKFIPQEEKEYLFKAVATTAFNNLNVEKRSHRYKNAIKLFGKGTRGSLKVSSYLCLACDYCYFMLLVFDYPTGLLLCYNWNFNAKVSNT